MAKDVIEESGFQYKFRVCVGQADHAATRVHWSSAILRSPGINTFFMSSSLSRSHLGPLHLPEHLHEPVCHPQSYNVMTKEAVAFSDDKVHG